MQEWLIFTKRMEGKKINLLNIQITNIITVFFMLILADSCITHKKDMQFIAQTKNNSKNEDKEDEGNDQIYREKTPKIWQIDHTKIALQFDWIGKTADVKEWIQAHPYFYNCDSLELDAKSMKIDSVILLTHTKTKISNYSYQSNKLKIKFDNSLSSIDTITLFLKYTAMPYAQSTGGSSAINDDRGLYFINTDQKTPNKPVEIWTQGESEANSHWLITIDKPNTKFTSQIELTVPDTMVTLSNGALINQITLADHQRKDIWKMDLPIQAYVAMFAIGKFSIVKDSWKGKEVNYYVEPEFEPYARKMFNNTTEMLEFFSKKTGLSFPWNKYDQVVVRDYVSGAMENTTAALFGEFVNANARELKDRNSEDVVAHELFHEWFGDYVTCASWSNLTVNESFANYGEQLWKKYKYGKAAADEHAYNDLQRYIQGSKYADPQLVRYYYKKNEDMFDGITYNKGGAILRYLNALMGDAAFDKAMQFYLTRNGFKNAEASDWKKAVEDITGQDWNWFFNEWYYHGGHPILDVKYIYDDNTKKLKVITQQSQTDTTLTYRLPLKCALIVDGITNIIDWNIKSKRDTFIFDYINNNPPVFVPDYTHILPGEIYERKTMNQWLMQYKYANDFVSKRIALSLTGDSISNSAAQSIIIGLALSDTLPYLRSMALEMLQKPRTVVKEWLTLVKTIATSDSNNLVRGSAIGLLGVWKDTTMKEKFIKYIYDSSYTVAGEALWAIYKIDSVLGYKYAKEMYYTNPKSVLENEIWGILGKEGRKEDFVLFEEKAPFSTVNGKYRFCNSLINYIDKVEDTNTFKKAVDLFRTMIVDEGNKSKRNFYCIFLLNEAEKKNNINYRSKGSDRAIENKKAEYFKSSLQKIIDLEKENSIKEMIIKRRNEIYY